MNLENAYALLIGVGADLPVTVKDASSIESILVNKQKAAYMEKNVVLLTEKDASRDKVLKALNELVDKVSNTDGDSTVIIYYSGHGGQYTSDTEDGEKYYLLTNGYDSSRRDETMISGDEFTSLVNKISAKKLLVMLDCCHAAGLLGTKPLLKAKSADESIVDSNIELLKKLKSGEGKVFITSCDDDEQSVILPGSENSLFTEVILDALAGQASQGEAYVRVIDLLYYVMRQVPKRINKFKHIQRPIINNIEYLSPDYYLCKAGQPDTIEPESVQPSIDNFEVLKNIIAEYNLTNSNQPIDIEAFQKIQESFPSGMEDHIEETQKIEKLLINGKTKKAILTFLNLTEKCCSDQRNNAILVAGRYNGLFREKNLGSIADDNYRVQLAQINSAVRYFLDECTDEM